YSRPRGLAVSPSCGADAASAVLLLNWACGVALKALPAEADLFDAELWSLGACVSSNSISSTLPPHVRREALEPFAELPTLDGLLEVLPYLAELFQTSNEMLNARGRDRQRKREQGVYYTP